MPQFNLSHLCLILLLGSLLTACANDSKSRIIDDARRFSVITRTDPVFEPKTGEKVAWYYDLMVEDSASQVKLSGDQAALIKNLIEDGMRRKGYQIVEATEQAQYILAAAVLLDNTAQSNRVLELIQLYPGLSGSFGDYENGTLAIAIIPSSNTSTTNPTIYWRGVIQAYTVGDALPLEVRGQRLRANVNRLVKSIPFTSD